jgi:phosphoserine phosphatase RsbU/P
MHTLLDDFDRIVDFNYPCGSATMGDALSALLDKANAESSVAWETSGIDISISSLQKECMHFYYRPHLYPEMDEKLKLAHKLQFNLLPTYCPQNAPVQLSTVLESYEQISGDLLGWRFLPDDSFLFYILDISGHGLKAGLLCAVLKTIIDNLDDVSTLEEFVSALNKHFFLSLKEKDELYYATGVFMRIDSNSKLEYISAAHPQVFQRGKNGQLRELHSTAIPIGLYPDRAFASETIEVSHGNMILLYTDGVTEAENPEGDVFGLERVRKIISFAYEYPEEITTALYKSLSRFQSFDALNDDVTFLSARVK